MITLHHLRIGRSIFTVWLLEELEVDYQLEVYYRDPDTMRAPESLKKIHPLGKSPVIQDGDLVLSESGAITSYILQKFDPEHAYSPRPSDLKAWAKYMQWLAYPEGSVFAPLLLKLLTLRSEEHPVITPFSTTEVKLHFDHIADQLGSNDYILGEEFSGADFGIAYMVSMAENLGLLADHPTLITYINRMKSRPAFLRAVEKAIE